jgi:hypothetical protein
MTKSLSIFEEIYELDDYNQSISTCEYIIKILLLVKLMNDASRGSFWSPGAFYLRKHVKIPPIVISGMVVNYKR